MVDSWVFSDIHFGHANIIRFKGTDGELIRPGFWEDGRLIPFNDDILFHDEMFIDRYNQRVKAGDRVYFLGDFGKPLDKAKRLNGKIRFIPGNHDDVHKMKDIYHAFDKIYPAWRVFRDEFAHPTVFTHMPIHGSCDFPVTRRINVHGHIHEKVIMRNGRPDPWYVNVCVEQTNFAPLHWDELAKIISDRVKDLRRLGEIE